MLLNYEIREKLEIGDIINFKSGGWISKITRKVSNSKYSHSALIYDLKDRAAIIAEYGRDGFNLRMLPYSYIRDHTDIYRKKGGLSTRKEALQDYIYSNRGKKYDFMGYLTLGVVYLFDLDKKAFEWESSRRVICSEYVGRAYEYIGSYMWNSRPDYLAPADIGKPEEIEKITL